MSPRLLAFAGVYPPAGGAGAVRQVKLFKYLRRLGWEVTVIAPAAEYGWLHDPTLAEEVAGVRVVRCGPGGGRLGGAWRTMAKDPMRQGAGVETARLVMRLGKELRDQLAWPDELLAWAAAAVVAARHELARTPYRAIFSSSFPYSAHLAAAATQAMSALRWVMELRDPWAGRTFRQRGGPRAWLDQHCEDLAMRRAAAITVISPGIRDLLASRHPASVLEKVHVVPNGFDPEDFGDAAPDRPSNHVELLYAGSFDSVLTPPGPVLKALEHLRRVEPELARRLRVRVLGGADLESAAQIRAGALGDSWQMAGTLPHRAVTRAMRGAHALLLVLTGPARVYTSKVFEYLASGTPILAVVGDNDCRRLLGETGGAVRVDPSDTPRLTEVLAELVRAGTLTPEKPLDRDVVAALAVPELATRISRLLDPS